NVIQSDASFVYANPGTHSISTNSSASVRNRYDQMRKIGATAKAMFVQAAADQWKVPATEITVVKGVVTHANSKRTATFSQLAPPAAALPLPADVPLKDPSQWKLIGQPDIARLEIKQKVTGKADFGVDFRVPNMLHAAIQHSPTLGGKATAFDESAKS